MPIALNLYVDSTIQKIFIRLLDDISGPIFWGGGGGGGVKVSLSTALPLSKTILSYEKSTTFCKFGQSV